MNLGPTEIIILLLLVLLFFGAKRLPELGRSLGQGLREFKRSSREIFEDSEEKDEEPVRRLEVASQPNEEKQAVKS